MTLQLSKSGIKCYTTCSYQYYLSYIEKVEQAPSPIMDAGTAMHKKFEDIVKQVVQNPKSLDTLTSDNEKCNIFINFLRKKAKYPDFKILMAEQKMVDPIAGRKGIVDLVLQFNGQIHIIDYKNSLYREERFPGYRIECAFYYLLLQNTVKIIGTHWGIYFILSDRYVSEKCHKVSITATIKKEQATREGILDKKFERNIDIHCNYCNVYDYCMKGKPFGNEGDVNE